MGLAVRGHRQVELHLMQGLGFTGVPRSYETSPPLQDHRRALGIILLQGPRWALFLMSCERGTPVRLRAEDSRFRVWGLKFRVRGLGFRV